jgi:hypothetical protein
VCEAFEVIRWHPFDPLSSVVTTLISPDADAPAGT